MLVPAHARLPPGGVQGGWACSHAQPGCPTRGAPSAAATQLLSLTAYSFVQATSSNKGHDWTEPTPTDVPNPDSKTQVTRPCGLASSYPLLLVLL